MENLGLVSVIMPVFNSEKYLKGAIESVLNQTYPYFELIVVNDGSTDRSEEIIKSFKDERIVYIKHEKNLGVAEARNTALKVAKGKWGAVIDADDVWLKERLEKLIPILVEGSERFFVEDDHILCFDSPNGLKQWGSQLELFNNIRLYENITEFDLITFLQGGSPLLHPIFPLSVVREKGIMQIQSLVPGEDLCFYFELFLSGLKLKVTKESYYLYRITPGSLTSKKPIDSIPLIVDYLNKKYRISQTEKKLFDKLVINSRKNYIYNTFTYYLKNKDFKDALSFGIKNPTVFLKLIVKLPYSLRYRIKAKLSGGIIR
ncbi:MAG: glycosyltransferase family 2 protein [Caldisericum sp.]|uniref:glycosyltransferase family 2 protein n=1 Tax=Caldisericum sp. TaxID=2499687 RepID=UPI003D1215B7